MVITSSIIEVSSSMSKGADLSRIGAAFSSWPKPTLMPLMLTSPREIRSLERWKETRLHFAGDRVTRGTFSLTPSSPERGQSQIEDGHEVGHLLAGGEVHRHQGLELFGGDLNGEGADQVRRLKNNQKQLPN